MTEPTKKELKRAEEIWASDAITTKPEMYMFDCNQSHTEHAIGLIAMGLAANREECARLQQVIIEINSLEMQARSGDAGALLEAEAKKIREASGIVFSETTEATEVRAVIDSEGNARLYPNRKPNTEE
jgi:hypothetical protein